jgi:hypothetical protein
LIQRWRKLGGPIQIGLVLGLIGTLLTVIGLLLGNLAPATPRSIILGILLGGGSWGVVSWAIAAVAADTADADDTEPAVEEEE